ncbi:MAG: SGNH/GDSL hydrolase family protein [Clostridia bacterium]|nr:SGNH/GDSL hydrolase family protein [Clostridia bacterium]
MNLQGKKINVLGDSITQGVGVVDPQNAYQNVMGRMVGAAEVRSFGISGTRLAKQFGEDNFPWPFTERFQTMPDDADLVIVFGGTNDYGHGDAPFGTFEDRTNETFMGACHYLFSSLVKKYPVARIVVMTPLQTSYDQNLSANTGKPLIAYVDAIMEVAAHYSLPVLDLYRTSGICPRIPEHIPLYMPDGLHPNEAGAYRIAERLAAFLNSL